jgi:hypothetical protein
MPKMMRPVLAVALAVSLGGCSSMSPGTRSTVERTAVGGGIGAASGAAFGAIGGNAALGAAAGAGAGILGGFIYDQWQKSEGN